MTSRLEDNPRLLTWAQSWPGRTLLLLVFAALFYPLYVPYEVAGRPPALLIIGLAAICSLSSRHRAKALALTTLVGLLLAPSWSPAGWLKNLAAQQGLPEAVLLSLQSLAIACLALLTTILFRVRQTYRRSWSLPLLFAGYGLHLALALSPLGSGPAGLILWTSLWAFNAYFYNIAFTLRDASSPQCSPAWFQLATFHPYFAGSVIPLGLGAAHLRQRQADDGFKLARCQLKSIKLLFACWLCRFLLAVLDGLRDSVHLMDFNQLMQQFLETHLHYPRYLCWLSLICAFATGMMRAFVVGNMLIAAARIGGFNLLQQCYSPWAARSIADYWNRVSYYYKETVLQLFFYPCYLGYFKSWPRLRQAFAIFMAAGVGNVLFHFRQLLPVVAHEGLGTTLQGMHTYFCYCVILCAGLYFSQLGSSQQREALTLRRRCLTAGSIFLFYSFLGVFDELYTPHGPLSRFQFLGYLWGLN